MCIRDMEYLVSIFIVASLELCSSSCSLGWISSALAVIMTIQRVQLILVTCEHEWASDARAKVVAMMPWRIVIWCQRSF